MASDCSAVQQAFAGAYVLLGVLFILSVVHELIKLMYRYRLNNKLQRTPKWLFSVSLIFIIISIITLIKCIVYGLFHCNYITLSESFQNTVFETIFQDLYAIQLYILWIVLLLRLYYTFKNTPYQLSTLTIRIYSIMFILLPLLSPLIFAPSLYQTFIVLSFSLSIFITLSIIILYCFKLVQVYRYFIEYKNTKQYQQYANIHGIDLLTIITKITVLVLICAISSFIILLSLIFSFIINVYYIEIIYQQQVLDICLLLDIYITVICVIFQFKYLHLKYQYCCNCIDRICRFYCNKYLNGDASIPREYKSSFIVENNDKKRISVSLKGIGRTRVVSDTENEISDALYVSSDEDAMSSKSNNVEMTQLQMASNENKILFTNKQREKRRNDNSKNRLKAKSVIHQRMFKNVNNITIYKLLKDQGFDITYSRRAMLVYERHYGTTSYNIKVIEEIIYRLQIKDKLNELKEVQNLYQSRESVEQILGSLNFSTRYIHLALLLYEVMAEMFEIDKYHNNIYDLELITEMIMRLRSRFTEYGDLKENQKEDIASMASEYKVQEEDINRNSRLKSLNTLSTAEKISHTPDGHIIHTGTSIHNPIINIIDDNKLDVSSPISVDGVSAPSSHGDEIRAAESNNLLNHESELIEVTFNTDDIDNGEHSGHTATNKTSYIYDTLDPMDPINEEQCMHGTPSTNIMSHITGQDEAESMSVGMTPSKTQTGGDDIVIMHPPSPFPDTNTKLHTIHSKEINNNIDGSDNDTVDTSITTESGDIIQSQDEKDGDKLNVYEYKHEYRSPNLPTPPAYYTGYGNNEINESPDTDATPPAYKYIHNSPLPKNGILVNESELGSDESDELIDMESDEEKEEEKDYFATLHIDNGGKGDRLSTIQSDATHKTLSFHSRMNSLRISQRGRLDAQMAIKVVRIEQELINTEKRYLEGLHLLMDEFIIPIFEQEMLHKSYKKQIICNIPQLITFHHQFYDELRVGNIASIFIKKADYFKMYIEYICEYKNILEIFAKCKKNKKLESYLTMKRKENKALISYLILPIQRIPRYMLLLSELKKKTPKHKESQYNDIDFALKKVELICNEINEKQREIENMSQCLLVSNRLKGLNINIVEPQRKYIEHFIFKRKYDRKNKQFFIFNDLMIIADIKWKTEKIINLTKFEAKRPSKKNEEILIRIIDEHKRKNSNLNNNNNNNKNENEPICYIQCDILKNELLLHENVSNIDLFCKLISKHRNKLFQIRHKSLSNNNLIDHDTELMDMIRDEQNKNNLAKWQESPSKGNKNKVLAMLKSPSENI